MVGLLLDRLIQARGKEQDDRHDAGDQAERADDKGAALQGDTATAP